MMGGRYQSADLNEMDYAAIARTMAAAAVAFGSKIRRRCRRHFVRAWTNATARHVIDVVVTRDPAQMLPAVDNNRTVEIKRGGRVA